MFTPLIQQIIVFATILAVFVTMQWKRNAPTDVLFCLALAVFVMCGIVEPADAWQGFADKAVIAIGGLLIVSASLKHTGVLDYIGRSLLGPVHTENAALSRISGLVVTCSAFLLNTAIVAMLLPVVISWCRRHNIAPSRLLLPISYLAILGGTCTLVGTSTNFVVNGELAEISADVQESIDDPTADIPSLAGYDKAWLIKSQAKLQKMQLFEISKVGVPCAIVGALLILVFGSRLFPSRTELLESLGEHRREYLVEMTVLASCPLIDKTVEEGGLRNLPGLFLIEIERVGEVISPVSPQDRIRENDRLVFTGVVSTIVDLEKIPGLVPAADINYEIAPERADSRTLVEVVLSPSSPLVGSTIRQANFRQHYGAAVVAVHRNGERLPSKIGDIELSPGDTLLLQTSHGFIRNFRNRPDFYLVSGVEDSKGRRDDKLPLASIITVGLITWLLLQHFLAGLSLPKAISEPSVAIFCAAMCMLFFRCISVADARRAIDIPMLVTIGAAIGVGTGFKKSQASDLVAQFMQSAVVNTEYAEYAALIALFVVTVLLTEMISNVAVAVIMVSIAIGLAGRLDASPQPFIMAITLGASLSFISPIGYQTNLMVMGPGGYRPRDYVKAGLPLSIAIGAFALYLIPKIWPFGL